MGSQSSTTLTGWAFDDDPLGIRVLVTLNTDVKFGEMSRKIEQNGFSYNRWRIK